jgi:hypothetical protein
MANSFVNLKHREREMKRFTKNVFYLSVSCSLTALCLSLSPSFTVDSQSVSYFLSSPASSNSVRAKVAMPFCGRNEVWKFTRNITSVLKQKEQSHYFSYVACSLSVSLSLYLCLSLSLAGLKKSYIPIEVSDVFEEDKHIAPDNDIR